MTQKAYSKDINGAPLPIDVLIGKKIKIARRLANNGAGMSQAELGDALGGLAFQQVQKYEKGTNRTAAARLFHIAIATKRPIGWFFEGLPGANGAATADPDDLLARLAITDGGGKLAAAYVAIEDPKLRRDIVNLVQSLAPAPGKSAP